MSERGLEKIHDESFTIDNPFRIKKQWATESSNLVKNTAIHIRVLRN